LPNNERLDLGCDRGARAALPQNCSPAKVNARLNLAYGTPVPLGRPKVPSPSKPLPNPVLPQTFGNKFRYCTASVPLECARFLPIDNSAALLPSHHASLSRSGDLPRHPQWAANRRGCARSTEKDCILERRRGTD